MNDFIPFKGSYRSKPMRGAAMRALSAAVVVFAGAICIAADVLSARLTSDHWGLFFGVPVIGVGLIAWLVVLFERQSASRPPGT
jgi:hypothetical protein